MPPQPEGLRLLVTTFAKEADATGVIRTLLAERLIACGTLLHRARSIYIWKGQTEDAEEIVVLLKTTTNAALNAAARLKELHPYDVPEILVHTVDCLNPDYTAWVADTCASQ